jgi:hypothetical protein
MVQLNKGFQHQDEECFPIFSSASSMHEFSKVTNGMSLDKVHSRLGQPLEQFALPQEERVWGAGVVEVLHYLVSALPANAGFQILHLYFA